MIIHHLTKQEAETAIKEWRNTNQKLPKLDLDYEQIRDQIADMYNNSKAKSDYETDVAFGLKLYQYLNELDNFSLRVAAYDDFWRYLSVKVVPHIVADRWGADNDDHFWKKNVRIWLRTLWWYIHLSWRGTIEDTAEILNSANFSTDTILNLVERSGRHGTFINVYRFIMYFFSRLPKEKIECFRSTSKNNDDLFRVIMKLNTARTLVIDPALYLGGEQEYVKSLFAESGCPV